MASEQTPQIKVALTKAGAADVPALAELAAIIWPEAFGDMITQAQIDYMLEHIQSAPAMTEQMSQGMHYWFIHCDDVRSGYAAVRHDTDTATSHLSKFYLLPAVRGGTVASAALDHINAIARDRGSRTLALTVNKYNARAIRFYDKRGFKTTQEVVMDIGGGFVMDDFCMELDLGGPQI
ncbi:MAG: GNAT family N-acetyltransferase [Gammaproteobacteria bacterium]